MTINITEDVEVLHGGLVCSMWKISHHQPNDRVNNGQSAFDVLLSTTSKRDQLQYVPKNTSFPFISIPFHFHCMIYLRRSVSLTH